MTARTVQLLAQPPYPDGATENSERKARGAFFTPATIAAYVARWAIAGNARARVLDPSCGDGAFLVAAGRLLQELDREAGPSGDQLVGVDIHGPTLERAAELLASEGLDARLEESDFFRLSPPGELFETHQAFDAVIGNPPFVRYQQHVGQARRLSAQAALRQGVRLSGLASSWAAVLVHAAAFLKPEGRIGIVLPAELLSVGYAEPIRQWLKRRFAAVKIVVFERLQFDDALENVVLLLAHGSGGCDAFSIYYVEDGDDLNTIKPFDEWAVAFSSHGKWTDRFLSMTERRIFSAAVEAHFVPLSSYGSPELGIVTGANSYFALTEMTRLKYDLSPRGHVVPISPPGTKHLQSLALTGRDWARLRDAGERVWLLRPTDRLDHQGLQRYLQAGADLGVPEAYKCQIRPRWWRPPDGTLPQLFFTYMSHRFPRLIANRARVRFLNSMHGVRLDPVDMAIAPEALPLLAMNSVTMLGAEVHGRSYGGGVLKMEPREAAVLPVPDRPVLAAAWATLANERRSLDGQLRDGRWTAVVARVDDVLLREVMGINSDQREVITAAARGLRMRRLGRTAAKLES